MPTIPSGYGYASQITIAAGATALTTSYTAEVALTSGTTPTAASVYGAVLAFTTTAPDGSVIDAANWPSGYPTDLTVWYQGAQIAAEVRVCTSSYVLVRFRLQAGISASATDSTSYVLAWGKASPATPSTYYSLTTVYLFGDNFGSTPTIGSSAGQYTALRSDRTVSVSGNVLSSNVTGGAGNPSYLAVTVPGATAGVFNPFDVEVEGSCAQAESSWASTGSRLGLMTIVEGTGAYELFYSNDTGGGAVNGIAFFTQNGVAYGANYTGLTSLAANTWRALRLRNTTQSASGSYGAIWAPGAVRPALTQNTSGSYSGQTGVLAGLGGPASANSSPFLYRYFRVRQAVTNDPTVSTAAAAAGTTPLNLVAGAVLALSLFVGTATARADLSAGAAQAASSLAGTVTARADMTPGAARGSSSLTGAATWRLDLTSGTAVSSGASGAATWRLDMGTAEGASSAMAGAATVRQDMATGASRAASTLAGTVTARQDLGAGTAAATSSFAGSPLGQTPLVLSSGPATASSAYAGSATARQEMTAAFAASSGESGGATAWQDAGVGAARASSGFSGLPTVRLDMATGGAATSAFSGVVTARADMGAGAAQASSTLSGVVVVRLDLAAGSAVAVSSLGAAPTARLDLSPALTATSGLGGVPSTRQELAATAAVSTSRLGGMATLSSALVAGPATASSSFGGAPLLVLFTAPRASYAVLPRATAFIVLPRQTAFIVTLGGPAVSVQTLSSLDGDPPVLRQHERNITFSLDFAPWLNGGETLTTPLAVTVTQTQLYTATDVSGTVLIASGIIGTTVTVELGNGAQTPGASYRVDIAVPTSAGRVLEDTLPLICCPLD